MSRTRRVSVCVVNKEGHGEHISPKLEGEHTGVTTGCTPLNRTSTSVSCSRRALMMGKNGVV